MFDFRTRVRPDWKEALRQVLERARANPSGVLVFDLDSTVFDNRPRQAQIVREYGKQRALPALEKCDVEHWTSGWDLKAALLACGLSPEEAEAHHREAKAFWGARFFTSAYCRLDVAIPGAAQYLNACVATGAQLIYVTGRHEEMREGSVDCMKHHGFPLPGGRVQLLMKPTLRESDDVYKRQTHQKVESLGEVLACFDNEPMHVNDYAERFPQAMVIHLATDHSGRPVELASRAISVPSLEV